MSVLPFGRSPSLCTRADRPLMYLPRDLLLPSRPECRLGDDPFFCFARRRTWRPPRSGYTASLSITEFREEGAMSSLLTVLEFSKRVKRPKRTIEDWIYRRVILSKKQVGRVLIPENEAERILVDRPVLKIWPGNR